MPHLSHYVFMTLSIQKTWPCEHDTLKSMNMIYVLRYTLLRESRQVRKFGTPRKALERYNDPTITSFKSENLPHIICTVLRNTTGLSEATTKDNEAIFRSCFPGYDIMRLPTFGFSREGRGGRGVGVGFHRHLVS